MSRTLTQVTQAAFIGSGSLLIQCAEAYLEAGHAVCAVVSTQRRIVQWAQGRGLVVFADEAAAAAQLQGRRFDYLFSIANPGAWPGQLVAEAQNMALHFHNAPLPAYAGWHAPTWALMAEEARYGVTWQQMTPAGSGRIVRQA
ncbi:MAG: MelG protein (non-ribosomal peptide synthetase)-like protein, partial [Polaromonas sp.]|nr:MelG protein (non-ribosomal peptide synthetase)-like protein [Polaromonas sp.]